jgi:cation transporter-like permease
VAFGWNIVVIVIGALVALIGIFAWLFADTGDSALHQTVAALWLLAGILGILISAVGILGATLAYALRYDP